MGERDRADGPVPSWVQYADQHGWSHDAWTTIAVIPTDELPEKS